MVVAKDFELAEETMRELRAQGRQDRAAALEAIVSLAASVAPAGEARSSGTPRWTVRQAARATGLSGAFIRKLIGAGRLPAVIQGGQTLIHPDDRWACLDALPPAPVPPPPSAEELEARRRQHEALEAALPHDKVARLEHLHELMEDGHRLSRAERSEMIALERELIALASDQLRASVQQSEHSRH